MKNLKKLVAILLSLSMVFATGAMAYAAEPAAIAPLAAGGTVDNFVETDGEHIDGYAWIKESQLHAQDGSSDKGLGNGWYDKSGVNNPLNTPIDKDGAYRVWKLEFDGGCPESATLWFYNDNLSKLDSFEINDITKSGNGATCQVIMPDGYRLVGGCAQCTGIKASYAGRHGSNTHGAVTVNGNVEAFHVLTTTTEHYAEHVTKYYDRDVFDNWYRDVTDIYQRYAAKFFVPVFEKKLAGEYNDTLVTRLDYSDNTAKAKPTNGDAFKNGHTYVTVNVDEASKEGGVWYTIADSSKNNGKKTPDNYNRPIDYKYNVKISNGKLTVSFGDNLAYASVGAEIWDKAPKDFKNAPKHVNNSVTVDVPKNKGTVDLYVHLSKLAWYDVDENGEFIYQFKEWKYDHTEYGRDWVYVDTKYGKYVQGETTFGEKVFDHDESIDELIRTEVSKEAVKEDYNGNLALVVTDADGNRVEGAELGQTLQLLPGTYTFTLEGEGILAVSKTVEITAGDNEVINLNAIFYNKDNNETKTVEVIDSTDVKEVVNDKEAVRVEHDNELTCEHKDDYIWKSDVHLGSKDDPNGEYAVKLN